MKKLFLFIVIILAILAGGGYWFWSLGRIPSQTQRIAILNVEAQGVEVRRSRDAAWEQASSGMQIFEGWYVRTNENGRATIRFYDQGETRLSQSTEVVIDKASFELSGAGRMIVSVQLQTGRVWSRILKLLDIGSSYDVRTTKIVATVRGTSFDMSLHADGSADLLVGESAVTVANIEGKNATSVAEGTEANFGKAGNILARAPADNVQDQWVMSNELADAAFRDAEHALRRQELQRLGGPRPDSAMYAMTQLSERMHLALAKGEEKNNLAEQYLTRSMYHVIELVESGKTGLAAQEFSRLEAMIKAVPEGAEGEANRVQIANALSRVQFLVEDADPSDALYPFKQRIENFTAELVSSDAASLFFVRMLALDARLDEASRAITNRSFDEARIGIDGVRDGIENIRRESAPVFPTLPDARRNVLEDKLAALDAREVMLRMRLSTVMNQPEGSATSTMPGITEPPDGALTPDAPSASSSIPVNGPIRFTSIEIELPSHSIDIGVLVSMKAKGVSSDGTKTDITNMTRFRIDDADVAAVNGTTIKGLRNGNGVITAIYNDGGTERTAKTNIVVHGKVLPVELILKSVSGNTLASGTSTRLVSTIRYNTDEVKNVTAQTTFSIASGGGDIAGSIFTAPNAAGSVILTGSTVENGLTIIGTLKLNVE